MLRPLLRVAHMRHSLEQSSSGQRPQEAFLCLLRGLPGVRRPALLPFP